jgi:hypothetical protein
MKKKSLKKLQTLFVIEREQLENQLNIPYNLAWYFLLPGQKNFQLFFASQTLSSPYITQHA